MIVILEKVDKGHFTVKTKLPFDSNFETMEFTEEGLREYLQQSYEYCKNNGYRFIFDDGGLFPIQFSPLGDKREKVGRKAIGITKKVSLTLRDEIWNMIEKKKEEEGISQSALLRSVIEEYFK